VLIRTAGPPENLAQLVRNVVRDVDPEQPISRLQTGRQAVGETIANPRFLLVIMGVFAAVAVTLAAVGVYGLVSFTVAQRTREIGLRMALGAQRRRVVGEVVRRGLLLCVAGAALGLGAAALVGRFVDSLLFGTSPLDPVVLGAAVLLLLACGGVSLVVPALNAAAVDPARTLRAE
jgi:putative ABC transport system permease protein